MGDPWSAVVQTGFVKVLNLFNPCNSLNECTQPTRKKLPKGQTCFNYHFLYNLPTYIMIMVDGHYKYYIDIAWCHKHYTFFSTITLLHDHQTLASIKTLNHQIGIDHRTNRHHQMTFLSPLDFNFSLKNTLGFFLPEFEYLCFPMSPGVHLVDLCMFLMYRISWNNDLQGNMQPRLKLQNSWLSIFSRPNIWQWGNLSKKMYNNVYQINFFNIWGN